MIRGIPNVEGGMSVLPLHVFIGERRMTVEMIPFGRYN
jgi:hypothetical protein